MAIKLLLLVTLLSGCATYQTKVESARASLREGRFSEAILKLQSLAEAERDDKLVYLLDYATALQLGGRIAESNKAFLAADELVDINDYHSVSNIFSATLGAEEMIQYKGESFEKYLINTMLALNFLSENNLDSAMVEARRINEKLSKMRMDGRRQFELSPFANYLSALIWEASGKFDDAYIDFERAYNLDPNIPEIGKDLIRTAYLARRDEALKKWQKAFPKVANPQSWVDKKKTEIFIVVMQGWGPLKQPRFEDPKFPMLVPTSAETSRIEIWENLNKLGEAQEVYNIEQVAIKTLEEDYAALVSRRAAALVAKEAMAQKIRERDETLGAIAWFVMHASERADVRQWSTLPRSIQFFRVPVNGTSTAFTMRGLRMDGLPTGESHEVVLNNLKQGEKRFVIWRARK